MIQDAVDGLHRFLRGECKSTDILAEDCSFSSPVVFQPARGIFQASRYLDAAYRGFAQLPPEGEEPAPGGFHYLRETIGDTSAVLEFEFTSDGVTVNGVDMIVADEDGKITDFKVMVRPRRALDTIQQLMVTELERPAYEISAQPLSKKRVKVNGLEMAYAEMGTGDPIVFLHGNPTSSYLWRNILPELSRLGRCIAPDLIGMGDSDKLPDSGPERYRFTEHREYLDAFLEALDVRGNVVLVLHDWGSALGFDWAHRHREALQGIAYMEAIVAPMTWGALPKVMKSAFGGLRSAQGDTMALEQNFFVEQMVPGSVLRALTDEEMEHYRAPFAEAGEARRPTLTWPRELPIDGEPADVAEIVRSYGDWLAGSEVPKLFVNAEPGAVLGGAAREVCRSWPNQREVSVHGIHYVQEDSPREIAEALGTFVEELRS